MDLNDWIHNEIFPSMSITFRKQNLAIHFCTDYEIHQTVVL